LYWPYWVYHDLKNIVVVVVVDVVVIWWWRGEIEMFFYFSNPPEGPLGVAWYSDSTNIYY